MFAIRLHPAGTVMNYVTTWVYSWENCFSIYKKLYSRFFCAEEPECYFIQSWRDGKNLSSIFLPHEVLRTGIHTLDFPRYSIPILEFSRFPKPPRNAILSTKTFIYISLFDHGLFEVTNRHPVFHFFMGFSQSFVHIINIFTKMRE